MATTREKRESPREQAKRLVATLENGVSDAVGVVEGFINLLRAAERERCASKGLGF